MPLPELPDLPRLTPNLHSFTSPEALAALAAEADDVEPDGDAQRWTITDEGGANWLLKKLAALDAERALVKAQAAEIVRSLDAEEARLRARHESDLRAWMEGELAAKGKGKTLRLLYGTLAVRTVPASLRVCGTADAIEYARSQGWGCVEIVESLDADAYKQEAAAELAQTGQCLPGVEVVPERESFSIRFPKAGKGEAGKGEGGGEE
jgi:phage host-nuclease inhibitor protein Gam